MAYFYHIFFLLFFKTALPDDFIIASQQPITTPEAKLFVKKDRPGSIQFSIEKKVKRVSNKSFSKSTNDELIIETQFARVRLSCASTIISAAVNDNYLAIIAKKKYNKTQINKETQDKEHSQQVLIYKHVNYDHFGLVYQEGIEDNSFIKSIAIYDDTMRLTFENNNTKAIALSQNFIQSSFAVKLKTVKKQFFSESCFVNTINADPQLHLNKKTEDGDNSDEHNHHTETNDEDEESIDDNAEESSGETQEEAQQEFEKQEPEMKELEEEEDDDLNKEEDEEQA